MHLHQHALLQHKCFGLRILITFLFLLLYRLTLLCDPRKGKPAPNTFTNSFQVGNGGVPVVSFGKNNVLDPDFAGLGRLYRFVSCVPHLKQLPNWNNSRIWTSGGSRSRSLHSTSKSNIPTPQQ